MTKAKKASKTKAPARADGTSIETILLRVFVAVVAIVLVGGALAYCAVPRTMM